MSNMSASTGQTRPVTLFSPFGTEPGALHDAALVFAQALERALGVPVHLEIRPELGNVTAYMCKQAPADGSAILLGGFGPTALDVWYENLDYSPVDDLRFAGQVSWMPIVLYASARAPFHDLHSFIAYAKAHPGLNVGIGMPRGGSPEPSTALLAKLAGLELNLTGGAVEDMRAGRLDIMAFHPFGGQHELVREGLARPIAVYSPARLPYYPHVPTLVESGYPVAFTSWRIVAVPRDTDEAVFQKIAAAVELAAHDPAFHAALAAPSHELPAWRGPGETQAWVRAQCEACGRIIDYLGMRSFRKKR